MYNKKRYLYLAMGTLMLLFLGLLYAWSIFAIHLKKIYTAWSASQLSLTFTISMVFFCIGGLLSGNLNKKLKSNYVIMISAAFLLAGFYGLSNLNEEIPELSLKSLYLFYGVFCGTGVGIGYNSVMGVVNKWFPEKVGFSSGILLMGFGVGGLILGSAVNTTVINFGINKTFLVLAIAIFLVLIVGAVVLKVPEKNHNKQIINDVNTSAKKEYTSSEMLKSSSYWLFFSWCIAVSSSGLLVISGAATIAVTFGAPAVLGLMVSVFNGAGRVLYGTLFDKFGYDKAMLINNIVLLISGISLTLGSISKNVVLIFVGLLLVGLCYGGSPALTSSVIHSFYGAKNYNLNFSLSNFSLVPAAFIGPMISSFLLEKSNGNYTPVFMVIIIFALIALVLKTFLKANMEKTICPCK